MCPVLCAWLLQSTLASRDWLAAASFPSTAAVLGHRSNAGGAAATAVTSSPVSGKAVAAVFMSNETLPLLLRQRPHHRVPAGTCRKYGWE